MKRAGVGSARKAPHPPSGVYHRAALPPSLSLRRGWLRRAEAPKERRLVARTRWLGVPLGVLSPAPNIVL